MLRFSFGCLRPHMRTSFHHQPEAQHPNSSAIHKLVGRLPHLCAKSGLASLFDHLVREREQLIRDVEIERLCGRQIDDELVGRAIERTSSSLWRPHGAKPLHRPSDRSGDSCSAGWRREHLLFSAINDHSGLKKHGRHT